VLNMLLFVPLPAAEDEFDLGDISSTNLVFLDDDGSITGARLAGRFLGITVIAVDDVAVDDDDAARR